MKRLLALAALLLSLCGLQAQQITVQAPRSVPAGQYFHVRFEVNGQASQFEPPTVTGAKIVSGPSYQMSSSTSYVNGRSTSSVSTTFDYAMRSDKEGTATIGAAYCTVGGQKAASQGFTIKITKPDPQQQQRQQAQSNPRQQASADQPVEIDAKSLFARASISKSNPYKGEQVIITYKIYTQVPLSQYQIDKLPGNKGFWSEDLSEGRKIKQYEETVDGRRYSVAEIRRGAMFAQESGNIRITPLDLDVLAMVQRRRTGTIWDLFDDPFFNSARAVEKHLRTNSLNVQVKPLPNEPEGFIGGVGSFEVKDQADLQEVRANEAVTYTVTISGSGNLMLINTPELNFAQNVEVYDPETKDKINRSDNGISGSRTFQWVLIPRSEGTLTIPETTIYTFDPKTGTYASHKIGGIDIKVTPGDPKAMQHVSNKSDVKKLNSDINFIKKGNPRLDQLGDSHHFLWFWIILASEIILACIAIAVGKRREAQAKDIAGTRLRRATKEARKRLRKAEAHIKSGNDNLFYEEVYKAIWGCLADKFNINLSQLSSDTVMECLKEKQVPEEQQQLIQTTLNDVDFARFAPGDKSQLKQEIYDKALRMIASL
ncbi:MAG: BatD family protein [Bacteroidales bacterium]|nr:BatD family protein [Bacteroidales bacterium]